MTDFAKAVEAVVDAQAAYLNAEAAETRARMAATDARNRLNEAQKAFDLTVHKIRESAPRDSDWKSNRRKLEVAA